ncbi:MAG: hypothetical protein JW797_06965, partial [Bradymonadales bacterium]|nr:hypothetical protein [Bradymonadales bacterium]
MSDSPCEVNTCFGRGTCIVQEGDAVCDCDEGYAGDRCETCEEGFHRDMADACVVDEICAADICGDHGTCVDDTGIVYCVCEIGYAGQYCEGCYSGYHDDGEGTCLLDAVCWPMSCSGHGTCE